MISFWVQLALQNRVHRSGDIGRFVSVLLDAGVPLNATNCHGETALLLAFRSSPVIEELIQLLLKSGALPNISSNSGASLEQNLTVCSLSTSVHAKSNCKTHNVITYQLTCILCGLSHKSCTSPVSNIDLSAQQLRCVYQSNSLHDLHSPNYSVLAPPESKRS